MLRLSPSRILKAAQQSSPATIAKDWSKTLNLPKSTFPARPTHEQLETYRQRCADYLYDWQRANRPSDERQENARDFVLHDGPPYANGAVHAGHALNKILKDIIVRSEMGKGRRVRYQPGWDCHGLPIELKALQQRALPSRNSKSKDPEMNLQTGAGIPGAEIRQTASTLATCTIEEQKREFRGWNVMGEWDAPYKTMDREFEIRQLGVFKEMVKKGLIFRDHRPVYWSPSSRTALAEAELEYNDKHKCTAAFIKMLFIRPPKALIMDPRIETDRISALIWTTTPWTLPANKAVAFNKDIEYTVVQIHNPESVQPEIDLVLLGKERVEHVLSYLPKGTTVKTIIDSIPGSKLVDNDAACFNIFQGQSSRFLAADFVTATSGTGLVHMAPGHGMEDYQVCQAYGIGPAFAPVDGNGRFNSEAFPAEEENSKSLRHLFAEKEGAKAVLEILTDHSGKYLPPLSRGGRLNLVLASHRFVHKNPIDWRTKEPVIVRATAQWFADVSLIRDRALEAIEGVRFIPESGRTRLKAFIEGRSQWCISRQRAWGVPIPALYSKHTGEALISEESITHIISVIRERGTDAWFSDPLDDPAWLHSSLATDEWVRGTDTMDVWFDSGTTWTSLSPRPDATPLADLYVEGTDQHRGWFQSSLLTAVATQDPSSKPLAPYKTLLTHGFILDGDGRKMSKSLGNVISPADIASGNLLTQPVAKSGKKDNVAGAQPKPDGKKKKNAAGGPDLLRLWVASSDYTKDVPISQQGLFGIQQALHKYRVTLKFLAGVLADHTPSPSLPANLSFADRAVLHRLSQHSTAVHRAFAAYRFHDAVREISSFVNADLSAAYFETVKDPLYAGLADERKRVQRVLATVLSEVFHWLAPLTPALVEEAWTHLSEGCRGEGAHPLQRVWEGPFALEKDSKEAQTLDCDLATFDNLSRAVKLAQEEARGKGKLGSGLACDVSICLLDSVPCELDGLLQCHPALKTELAGLLVVSAVDVVRLSAQEMESVQGHGEWGFESVVERAKEAEQGGGEVLAKVRVGPPKGEKCVRCWNFVAREEGRVCGRCVRAVEEKESLQEVP